MKNVLLIIIDALASRVVRPAMQRGRLPHMQALAEAGHMDWNCTAIFPSITPAATAALVTGGYPCETGIAGAYFYDPQEERVHYYGDDTWPIMRRGFSEFFENFLVRLNRDQLRIATAFETVEQAGKQAASLNYLWFRGESKHRIHVPWLLRLWPGIPYSKTIAGPSILSLGDFVSGRFGPGGRRKLRGPGGIFRRFGFNDAATCKELLLLAQQKAFPEFTLAYFPDNDFASHAEGAEASLVKVEQVDQTLGRLAKIYGGMPMLLQALSIVITGDHAQSDLPLDDRQTGVQLDKLLDEYTVVPAGENWRGGDELMVCPNMRAAQIYLRGGYRDQREEIINRLLADPRIDQVIWRRDDGGASRRFCVQTRRQGMLDFGADSGDSRDGEAASDAYGMQWKWQGNLAAVDARVDEQGMFMYGKYPNALERIAMAFDAQVSGDLWVTSEAKYEFRLDGTTVHRQGSHGSLHTDDSLSPLIMAGVPEASFPTTTPRSVDIAPLCLSLLGLKGHRPVGASHAGSGRSSRFIEK